MKKSIIITSCLAVLAFSSCKKSFLDQTDPNAVALETSFKTSDDVLLAVNGIYQSLRSSNNVGESSQLWTDERSDDAGRNDNQSNSGEPFQFNDFSLLPSNTYLKSHWSSLYNTISRANVVLDNIDNVTFADANLKKQYAAEAKTLRAFMYFHLVRLWGDVPLVTKQLKSAEEVAEYTYRVPEAQVYAQIVADLTDALDSNLPDLQTNDGIGRVSKAAINALLGKVYLTMANTVDQANRQANLNNAKTYLTNAYNMRSFTDLKSIPYADVFSVAKKSTCPEIIWQIVYRQGDANYSSSIAASNQAKGETINSLKPASGSGGNVKGDLINEYEAADTTRMNFSVKYANDPIVKDYFITKYRDASAAAGNLGYGGNNWILIRYADVILMLAEVNAYLGDNGAAVQYLDMVRARAGMPDYATSMQNSSYSTKFPTLKLAILHERRVELAFEHHRWFDLLRTFTTQELVTYFRSKDQSAYGIANLSNFTTKDRYYPIPFDEYKLNPEKMYQNPGY